MRYVLACALPARRSPHRRGQALVEMAVVSLALYLLLAAILTFGQLLYGAQTLQSAADTAAREIARTPLPPSTPSLYDVLYSTDTTYAQVRAQVFDQQYLNVNVNLKPPGMSYADWVKSWPIVNQMLYPLMIIDYRNVNDSSNGQNQEEFLWYPGAVPGTDGNGWPAFRIALVTNRENGTGPETIEWVPVIEETRQDDPSKSPGDSYYAFNVLSQDRGLVALRINYPYQSATMSAFEQQTPATFPTQLPDPVVTANDSQVVVANPGDFTPSPGALSASAYPTYSGPYGLGTQYAWLKQVRPFRRVVSAQAVARREVFQNPTQ